MPLSEHEQRILAELEESLARHDPRFAERVRAKSPSKVASNQLRWSVLGFIAGLTILIAFYAQSVAAGLVGVAVMFASAVAFERSLRRLGAAGWRDGARSGTARGRTRVHNPLRGTRGWLRSRRPRRDD